MGLMGGDGGADMEKLHDVASPLHYPLATPVTPDTAHRQPTIV